MIILLDMDGVIADCEDSFRCLVTKDFPGEPLVPTEDRKSFYFEDEHPFLPENHLYNYMHTEGFFRDLAVIPGAQQGVKRLLDTGATVKVCTKPVISPYCVKEKMEWVEEHFPELGIGSVITTKDKTLIRGDFLIDDMPEVTGALAPEWRHIPFRSGQRNTGTFDWQNMDEFVHAVEWGISNNNAWREVYS